MVGWNVGRVRLAGDAAERLKEYAMRALLSRDVISASGSDPFFAEGEVGGLTLRQPPTNLSNDDAKISSYVLIPINITVSIAFSLKLLKRSVCSI